MGKKTVAFAHSLAAHHLTKIMRFAPCSRSPKSPSATSHNLCVKSNPPAHFRASDPDSLAVLFEEKEKQIEQEKDRLLSFISKLKVKPSGISKLSDFEYFSGIRGIKSLYTEIINSWKAGDEYFIASAPLESFSKLEGFFLDVVHKKRIKDEVKLKILINKIGKKWGLLAKRCLLLK